MSKGLQTGNQILSHILNKNADFSVATNFCASYLNAEDVRLAERLLNINSSTSTDRLMGEVGVSTYVNIFSTTIIPGMMESINRMLDFFEEKN